MTTPATTRSPSSTRSQNALKPEDLSPVERLALLTPEHRKRVLDQCSPQELRFFKYHWRKWWARPKQLAPAGDWVTWVLRAGRTFGKTRTGAEWIRERVESGRGRRIALVAPTAADAREVMVEGPAGILAVSPPSFRPYYEPSKRRLTWPNGAIATTYSADEPERLRGPQHDSAWCDELAAWRFVDDAWDMLQFGLRVGDDPRCLISTTPKPIEALRQILRDKDTRETTGSSFENRTNVSPVYFDKIVRKYEGTRLGRQELYAEILDDTPGALWTRALIESLRVKQVPELLRIVVAIDPAMTSGEDADETGIIVAGVDRDENGYVLDDLSGHYTPGGSDGWAAKAISAYSAWKADLIVAEVNAGGEMVEATLRAVQKSVPYRGVHASKGKVTRAEPVSALYEQRRIHHVGSFPTLEDQMCSFTSDFDRKSNPSPDRVDAMVWAFAELIDTDFSADIGEFDFDVSGFTRESPWRGGMGHSEPGEE